ncbi:MAG: tRNA (N(6)-L-threonylcarbamoyladenosine(37)-C(2))-methylthiotransferase MtaB [Clostridia bacterium]|nr:tRNA (N(6)-L-threonylcarbamoyladenosine(37)-C(2))-methylthiotransferase MtaB [Clostridia bacterium]
MKKVAFYTLGCKVNQYETEAISGIFAREGYQSVDFDEKADVYVINTCTVTNLSDRKSRQMIRKAKKNNENSIVVVVGCYAQTAPEEVSQIPGVNLILGTKERSRIIDYIKEIEEGNTKLNLVSNIMTARDFEDLKVDTYKERTRAYLKIQEGCSQFCAYCIIPYARGPIRSRQPEDVIDEVKSLAKGGFKEIVLTGIHVASYGKDIKNTSLLDIIKRVHEVEGIERIRLGSIEPTTITEEFVNTARNLGKLCPHYHISLQSGCDKTLKRMNRKYTTDEYKRVVQRLRDNIEGVAITTDVMVGFPGETNEDFEETYSFLDEISFAQMHVFKYSPRKGTPAAAYTDQVSPEEKDKRSERLIAMARKKTFEFNSSFEGHTLPVLFEQDVNNKEGFIEGLTSNYIRVLCKGDTKLNGEIMNCKLLKADEDFVTGELINIK